MNSTYPLATAETLRGTTLKSTVNASILSPAGLCEGRATLTSGVPVTTTDVTGATSIFFTPYNGCRIAVYDGSRIQLYTFAELTLALGTLVNAQQYDVFVYDNGGTLTLETAEWASATITCTSASPGVITWTAHGLLTGNSTTFTNSGGALPTGISANVQYWITKVDANTFKISTTMANVAAGTFVNTSSTGTGTHTAHSPTYRATALVLQNGVPYKTGALTRRYLFSFIASSTTTTEDSTANRYLSNAYNRKQRMLSRVDTTDTWNYTTATLHQANASDANRVNVCIGLSEELVEAMVVGMARNTSAVLASVDVGVDSTNAGSAQIFGGASQATGVVAQFQAIYKGYPGIGWHSLVWQEISQASGTTTWEGDNGGTGHQQSGISGIVWG